MLMLGAMFDHQNTLKTTRHITGVPAHFDNVISARKKTLQTN